MKRKLDRKDSGDCEPIITNEHIIAGLRDELDELAEALKEARPCVEEIADQVDCTAPHKAASIYALLARIDAALAKAGVK